MSEFVLDLSCDESIDVMADREGSPVIWFVFLWDEEAGDFLCFVAHCSHDEAEFDYVEVYVSPSFGKSS